MTDISRDSVDSDINTYFVSSMNSFANNITTAITFYNNGPIGAERNLVYCNNALLDIYYQDPITNWVDATWYETYLSGSTTRTSLANRVKVLARWYARSYYGLWGLTGTTSSGAWDGVLQPFEQYAYFFINPLFHTSHYNNVVSLINAVATDEFTNNMNRSGLASYISRIKNIVVNNMYDFGSVDLRVCHSSCHSNCHGSRGRR